MPAPCFWQGCATVGPDYAEPPKPQFELEWSAFAKANAAQTGEYRSDWWGVFDDPQLTQLIEEATNANYDIREALLRISEARAVYRAQTGQRLPQIGADGTAQRLKSSENAQIPLGQIPGASPETSIFSLGVGASWEIDFFGRVSRAVEAAGARADVARELYDGTIIAVQADTAAAYFEMRGLDSQIAATKEGIAARERSVELSRKRANAGAGSRYELSQAQSGLRELRAALSPLEAERRTAVNRLAILTGKSPAQMEGRFASHPLGKLPDILVPTGLPSSLLERRPDIRAAERELAAETAEIGLAEANRLPRFSLTGSVGVEATEFSDLFSSDSVKWSLGGLFDFTLPFLGGDRLNQEVIIARSEAQRAGLNYERTVLAALQDVEGSLILYAELRKAVAELEAAKAEQQQTAGLAKQRYDAGYSRLFEYLEQEEKLTAIDNRLAQRRAQVAAAVVQLYRGLGGSLDRTAISADARRSE